MLFKTSGMRYFHPQELTLTESFSEKVVERGRRRMNKARYIQYRRVHDGWASDEASQDFEQRIAEASSDLEGRDGQARVRVSSDERSVSRGGEKKAHVVKEDVRRGDGGRRRQARDVRHRSSCSSAFGGRRGASGAARRSRTRSRSGERRLFHQSSPLRLLDELAPKLKQLIMYAAQHALQQSSAFWGYII